jgi:23S rRNA (guanosine2251-2'-O)-methyltransferase
LDILYGRNPVLEALRSGRPARKIVVAAGIRADTRVREIVELARVADIPLEESPRRRLDDIAHTEHHQGIAGYFHTRQALQLDDLLQVVRSPALLMVLDGVQDPQNLGAITRTCEACDVDGIVLSRHHAAALTAAAAKASAGATEHVPVAVVSNLVRSLDVLHEHGIWRVGLDAGATARYDSFDYTQPLALVLGAEGEGLRPLVQRTCDAVVSLPMLGRIASLNVGASAAVMLYEVQRQRGFAPRERA